MAGLQIVSLRLTQPSSLAASQLGSIGAGGLPRVLAEVDMRILGNLGEDRGSLHFKVAAFEEDQVVAAAHREAHAIIQLFGGGAG